MAATAGLLGENDFPTQGNQRLSVSGREAAFSFDRSGVGRIQSGHKMHPRIPDGFG